MSEVSANAIVEAELDKLNISLGEHLNSHVIFIKSAIVSGLDDAVRTLIEQLNVYHRLPSYDNLSVILETDGGQARAKEIATILGNPQAWHSHGRGIHIKDLIGDKIKLQIDDYSDDKELSNKIKIYYNLLVDYCRMNNAIGILHTPFQVRIIE